MRSPAGGVAIALAAVTCAPAAVAAVAVAPADGARGGAARIEQGDPRDLRSPLDVKEVDTATGRAAVQFSIVTWSRWRTSAMHDRAFILIRLYTRPGGGSDYNALVRSNGPHLRGILFRAATGRRERRVGSFRAWRSDRQSVSLRLPLESLDLSQPGATFSWHVQAIVTSSGCKRVCFDRVPDQAAVVETVPPAAA